MRLSQGITNALQQQHPELCYLFRVFLKSYLDGGYWQMWMEIDQFKESEDEDPEHRRQAATRIFEKYWSPSAEFTIDIKPKIKDALAQRIEQGDINTAIFDDALAELEQESYKKFLRSDSYAGFMAEKGVYVRTSSPKRRVSITELFKKKTRRGSNLKFSTEIDQEDPNSFSLEGSTDSIGADDLNLDGGDFGEEVVDDPTIESA